MLLCPRVIVFRAVPTINNDYFPLTTFTDCHSLYKHAALSVSQEVSVYNIRTLILALRGLGPH